MKKLFVAAFLLCSLSVCAQTAKQTIQKFSATQVRQLIDTSTVPTIVNFWATWCGPCIREIPYLEEQVKGTAVRLILVNIDFPDAQLKRVRNFVSLKGYSSQVIYLNEEYPEVFLPVIEKQWTGAIPASIFVNNASQYYRFFNTQLTQQQLALELRNLLRSE